MVVSGPNFVESNLELCPLGGRRSDKEVWMKLFAVHLTTIAAFCHVLSLRRERIMSWKLLAYLLEPASVMVAQVPPLLVLTVAVMYWMLFDRTRRLRRSLKRTIGRFLSPLPESESANRLSETEAVLKACGRTLLAYAFLAHCSGTMALFLRRAEHAAVTWVDIRIVEVAATGILTSLYWILRIAGVSSVMVRLPSGYQRENEVFVLETIILRFRGVIPLLAIAGAQPWRRESTTILLRLLVLFNRPHRQSRLAME